ncbi:3-hydroxyacyl-CoA dehydrogenase NAD-binding domain-containing protein [Brevibacterium sp. ZH18]|uniref:3-hydroxyacyl-CoA dehydrogenase NAD-binding domain-containing protein n=1 Tax=Brevibacterium sp. ZH18 TaxID=2927784 RepID=UPI001F60D3F3|nr:3-hydroxyacyl-CoA dehydrogenase NAD-binding domain-containing protein [Brevibacterium sp. ZH18]MCI4011217.1 3-hydroxyacyl-CoA dehydrogenase NAD-binding domain-containing protein [Brevibacterium sp. ZH18]
MSTQSINLAIIGTGVIGAAWATGFLTAGHRVTAFDPAEGAEERLREQVTNCVEDAGSGSAASLLDNLTFAPSLAEAVAGADFVQENGPERLEVKQSMLAEIDAAAPESAIIASSTSGFSPSQLNAQARKAPGRIVVGHPFNPAHLVPLVEVVPSADTSAAVVDRALEVYRAIGKKPILVRAELPGHVANRLQAAMWQEAYSLVERGVVTVSDIDTAISYGPGLRWAILGPLAQQSLSGGAGGMRHVLDHLGPPQEVWMRDLRQVHLGEDLKEKLISGVDEELRGRDPAVLAKQRDDMLLELIALKRKYGELP